jgi:deoxyribonuclease-4
MNIGAHVSIRGGLINAPRNAGRAGCECFQIFTRSPRGRLAKPITPEIAREFRTACAETGQMAWYVHTPYYINLASDDTRIADMSVRIVREDFERATAIGATALMTHMGGARGGDAGSALTRVIENIRRITDGYHGATQFLVEIATGSGSIVGTSFEELAAVIERTDGRCGVCLDTQHMFASGYDIRSAEAVGRTLDEFHAVVGCEHLKLLHANDSKVPLGSRKDRHEHIGKGAIGLEGFGSLLREPRLAHVDFVMETRSEGIEKDVRILKSLRDKRS